MFNRLRTLLLACAAATVFPAAAHAQCVGRWLPGYNATQMNGAIWTFAPLPSGDVFVGGTFQTIGGIAASRLARFTPATRAWAPVAGGTNGPVYAIAPLPSGDIIIGGQFSTVGVTTAASNIARFTPASGTWSALGSGITGSASKVDAILQLPSGELLVSGVFQLAGGVPGNNIALYNPATNTWRVSSTIPFSSGELSALINMPDGSVIVSGTTVARYNPTARTFSGINWTGGPNTFISLAPLPGGDILMGLAQPALGGSTLVRYSAAAGTWSAVLDGGALTNPVLAMAPLPDGSLAMAGAFLTPGAPNCRGIARYNPTTHQWGTFGNGIGADLNAAAYTALSLPTGELLLGGSFLSVQGQTSVNFGQWTTRPTCPADFNCSSALEVTDIFDFINAWLAASPDADFNGINGLEVQDIFDFLNAWFQGC